MQKAILVKDGSTVINKMVYSGGNTTFDDFMDSEMTRLQAKYPSYTFTLYSSDTDSDFTSATIDTYVEVV